MQVVAERAPARPTVELPLCVAERAGDGVEQRGHVVAWHDGLDEAQELGVARGVGEGYAQLARCACPGRCHAPVVGAEEGGAWVQPQWVMSL